MAQTVIDQAIANANPCAGLKKTTMLGTVGIDKLKAVHLETADASLQGSDLKVKLNGHIACRTSDQALLEGDASADIEVTGQVSLKDCSTPALNVSVTNFGGTFGSIISQASSQIASSLRTALIDQWKRVCETLTKLGK